MHHFQGHISAIHCLAISPDGRQLLSGSEDKFVFLWNLEKKKELGRFAGHKQPVVAVAFTDDRRYFLSAGHDKRILRWQVDEEGPKQRIALEDYPASTTHLAFSPDAKRLAGSASDGRVIVWDATNGKKLVDWRLPGPVLRVAFHPEGKHLATANANGTVYIFRIEPPMEDPE